LSPVPSGGAAQRGPVDRPALSRCVSVGPDAFAVDHWGRAPLLSTALGPFDDLFDADAVDELVSRRGIRTPFVRMAREGSVLPASAYTAPGGYGAEVGDQLDSTRVLAEFAAGSTIVLQGLHRTWAPIGDFTRQLVDDLGHPCQVNAYVTPASSRGFDPHYDVHDVFVMQIHGEKHWTVHAPVHPDPLAGDAWTDHRAAVEARAAEQPAIDATLRPGDVLYLPRGWIHSATALGGTSIHLTVGMAALTRHDVLQRLVTALAEDPGLRSSLPLGGGFADAVGATIAEAAARLAEPDDRLARDIAGRLDARVRASTRPAPVRPLATVDAIGALDPHTVVGWRPHLAATISDDAAAGAVRIGLRSTTLTLPAEAAPALRALRERPAPAGALDGLDEASSLVVARRLLREGVLVAHPPR